MRTDVVVITDRRLCSDLPVRIRALASIPGVAFQVREKDLDGGALLALARAIVDAAHGAPVWVNDRLDIAVLAGATGVHLPEAGMAIADAKQLAPSLLIGASRHTIDAARAADDAGADVVQLGPLFATPGKSPIDRGAFAAKLRARLVAVGGIVGPDQARAAIRAGANAVAVIRAAWTTDPSAIAAIADAVRDERAAC